MAKPKKVETQIRRYERMLIAKAKKKGLYENFGQTEVRQLKNDYHYNDLVYGTPKQRKEADKIDAFDRWARTFDDRRIKYYDM